MYLSPYTSNKRARPQSQNVSDLHNIEDMLASIRLRVAHHDVYEEWEQQTRKDAFVSSLQVLYCLSDDVEAVRSP